MAHRKKTRKEVRAEARHLLASLLADWDLATTDSGATRGSGKNPAAVALGRLGGKKGGPARAKQLTPEQRSKIASKAASARWEKKSHE